MTQRRKTSNGAWIDKLVRFFQKMPGKKPDLSKTDYSGWHQGEEQYQKEQAEWLKQVDKRKKQKSGQDGKNPK